MCGDEFSFKRLNNKSQVTLSNTPTHRRRKHFESEGANEGWYNAREAHARKMFSHAHQLAKDEFVNFAVL